MYGFDKAKTSLEFDKVIRDISVKCVSETGKARLRNSVPIESEISLKQVLRQISEMRDVYQVEGGLPIWEYADVRILLNKIEPAESYLEIQDCLKIQNILEIIADILVFFRKTRDKFPELQILAGTLNLNQNLLNQLKFTIEPSGRIYDNASDELKMIRKDINRLSDEIHIRMNRIQKKHAEFLQEEYITLRDGRLVLPVREFSVSKIPGIVHGQSASGATYFVEPMSVVDLNNQMQKLIAAEKREIVKILKRIAAQIRDDQQQLIANFHILNDLDVLQAKAKYANEINATAPEVSQSFFWRIRAARHPILLKKAEVDTVPLDLEIGETFRELIISGPNAGGKTVALKTLGIHQLMFQCGFHIPVAEGSHFPVCKQIFTVIGDEQSIEQDLSTFSSHIQAIGQIFNHLDDQALILIDEIGTGTEPSGGAALAISILEKLNREGLVSIVSTHHNQLKAFGSHTEGVLNAAMQFDNEHLTPLFTLEMGIPGSSYTFEICKRLGLDQEIIEKAIEKSGEEVFKLDRLLADVVKKSQEYKEKSRQISIRESELNSLVQLYRIKDESLKKQRKKLEKEAAQEAKKILDDANRKIEKTIREIRESDANKQVVKNAKKIISDQKKEIDAHLKEPKPAEPLSIEQLKPGMKIRSVKFDVRGTIAEIFPQKKQVALEKDGMTITVDLSDIELLESEGAKTPVQSSSGAQGMSPPANVPNELDLRGLPVEEALESVDSYLDKAVLSSWDQVRIIHGKGTGALKEAVHSYLSKHKKISSFRLGRWGEGDTGVTVVQFRE